MTTATAGILIEKYLSWESSELASDILLNGLVSTQGEAVSSQRTSQTSTAAVLQPVLLTVPLSALQGH